MPTSPADVPLAYDANKHHHIVVLANDRYFKVDTRGKSASQLAQAFKDVKQMAAGKAGSGVGVLTADDRDVWTEVSCGTRSALYCTLKRADQVGSSTLDVAL